MNRARILGFEWDASSSHARGAALGPTVVKCLLSSEASSSFSIGLVDMHEAIAGFDIPELSPDGPGSRAIIERAVADALVKGESPLSIGGDHSITFPILKAVAAKRGPVNVLHIDAHPDLHHDYEGDPYSHASPFARAHESRLIAAHVAVGIRCWDPGSKAQADRFGVTILAPHELEQMPPAIFDGPLYLTIDLDGLDPAFAPGVSHPEPGGLSTSDVLALIRRAGAALIGADIVELNPERDPMLATARVTVRLIKEIVAAMTRA